MARKSKKQEVKDKDLNSQVNENDFILKQIENVKEELNQQQKQEIENFDKEKYIKIDNQLFLRSSLSTIPTYPNKVNGLLFLGDPHYWSKRPGRRIDDFRQTVLNKLQQVISYANENNYLIVCLGDLFEKPDDNDIESLTKLIHVLKQAKHKIVSNVGNHDINETKLTEKNPLFMLEEANLVGLFKDNGFAYKIELETNNDHTKYVLLGATPYGKQIPDNVLPLLIEGEKENKIYKTLTEAQLKNIEEQEKGNRVVGNVPIYLKQSKVSDKVKEQIQTFKNEHNIQDVVWLTHHDLAMNGAYPNSIPLKEIVGVDKVINGHIHGTKQPVKVNSTVYYNTGNITRMKIDMLDHKPVVFVLDYRLEEKLEPSINGELVESLMPFYLNCEESKNVFKLTGKHAGKESLTDQEIEEIKNGLDLNEQEEKVFASLLLKQEEDKNSHKTDDGVIIKESLANFLNENEISDEIKEILISLQERSINLNIEK